MVQGPYLAIGVIVLVWALLIVITKFPKVAVERAEGEHLGQKGDFGRLFANRNYVMGVVAQFFYVGAQVGVWSFIIRYAQQAVPGMGEKTAADYLFWSIVGFAAGRFVGTALMGRFRADRLMMIYAVINVILCLVAVAFGRGHLGLYALAATSFFMSIMFPTIFAVALRGLGPLAKLGSSFLIMSNIAGALMPLLMGLISDITGSMAYAMIVPAICFGVIAIFASGAKNVPVANITM
jgi:FHS family L-fucose permease-like MFS transporter